MADRPWTELYVSFCMKKFVPPSFELLTKALEPAGCPADLLPRLEAMVTQCLRQVDLCVLRNILIRFIYLFTHY